MKPTDRFKQRREEIGQLRSLATQQRVGAPEFKTWRGRTQRLIDEFFGEGSKESKQFEAIRFTPYVGARVISPGDSTPDPDPVQPFLNGCESAHALLGGIISDLEEGVIAARHFNEQDSNARIVRILDRFHQTAHQLTQRQRGREPFLVQDEYDVQDLLHALLGVDFDDIRCEEPTPSSAGGGSRVDFLLKEEGIVLEIKMTRAGLSNRELREQLGADITYYAAHPDCRVLYCFVYDPQHLLKQPEALERDLSGPRNEIPVTVMVRPRLR